LIAVKVISPSSTTTEQAVKIKDVADHLKANVAGEQLTVDEGNLGELSDVTKIQKLYKISAPPKSKSSGDPSVNGTAPSAAHFKELERTIIGMMIVKGS
jgi:hypothetical protein